MANVRVTVVPVALRAGDEESGKQLLSVSQYMPEAGPLTESLTDARSAIPVARRLLERAVPPELPIADAEGRPLLVLENAGVEYLSGSPNLLLTSVLPIAATELRNEDWSDLVPWGMATGGAKNSALDPARTAVVSYWRDQLTRTTAAFDFLPKYFTVSQVRAVYESLWGGVQPEGNFQRWLTSAKDASGATICREAAESSIREEAQAAFVRELSTTGVSVGAATAGAIAGQWDPKFVGTSAKVTALSALAVIPAAVVAGALVGSLVSWQRSRSSGRPASWYHRTKETRTDLKALYSVRPALPIAPVGLVE